ncbi:MAG: ComF family protein [Clostridiaceae bacterium]|nr:ComF family protein [Clostridiaceae bacterium]
MLQVVYPVSGDCIICKGYTVDDRWLCSSCENKIKYCQERFEVTKNNKRYSYYCLAYYSKGISELVLRLKYKSDFACANALGEKMAELIVKNNLVIDFITFVPATKQSLMKRGYNQSQLLAKVIGEVLKVKVISTLDKIKETKDQIGLNEEMRWQNISGSYKLRSDMKIKNKKILLVDDVMTTGATTFCCAEELIKSEVNCVIILTAAKSKL